VIGTASAYALARRGLNVALVDRNPGPALGTSFANGAQLSYAYSDTLGSPALLRKLPAMALGADPLFRIRPWIDPDMARWGLSFLRHCSRESQLKGTLDTLALALESQAALHALLERHPIQFGHAEAGKMHLYFDRESLAGAEPMVAAKRAHGAQQHILSAAEAIAIEPALTQSEGLVGAVYSPHDAVGDPHRFSRGLAEVLARDYGVQLQFDTPVVGVDFAADEVRVRGAGGQCIRGRVLLVALGVDAGRFLASLGIQTSIQPLKGYSFTAPEGPCAPTVSLTDTLRKLVFCRLSGSMRIAGGAELGVWNTRIATARINALIAAARASLPQSADYHALESRWAGLRPMSPDSVPVIRRPRERLVVNIGHGMLGWTLAMGAAERTAALVTEHREAAEA